MKLVKYFLQKKAVTILLLVLILAGGLFSYIKMGKLEDAPFTIKQALVLTPYPGASPSEVQSQVTDVLEESIQSLGELYYLYNPQNEMFRLLGTKRSFSQNETFFFSHPYPALFRLISHF